MEHSLPATQVAPQWRTATLVAGGIAALELAILIALGLPMLGHAVSKQVRTAAEKRVLAPASKPQAQHHRDTTRLLPRKETAILILNGNGQSGAAAGASHRVHRFGYIVAGVGNASRSNYAHSIVMYRPGRGDEAKRLAKDLHVKVVGRSTGCARAT